MCGIAGWIDWQEDVSSQKAIIETMIERLSHRGPDSTGFWLSPCVALAHQRLSVVDPAHGGQPMIYREGGRTYVIIYNGELYNFQELRVELQMRGHSFQTNSDTEVLLHTYVEWGEECTQHLSGIFAFALWDESQQQLLLARDHLGVKPLFYIQRGSSLLFASEIKALLANPRVDAEVDAEGLAEIFSFASVRTPGFVIYRGINEVRPGEQLVFSREGMRVSRYWSLRSAPHTDDLPTTIERVRSLLANAVKQQIVADVPIVATLSGGLDSSGLVALATKEFQRQQRDPLRTYSLDFLRGEQYVTGHSTQVGLDEPWVKRVCNYVGTHHRTIMVDSSQLIENLMLPMYAHDMPSMTTGQVETSLYLLYKAMREEATVAFTGDAADEIFGSHAWFFTEKARTANTFPWLVDFEPLLENVGSFPWWSSDVSEQVRPQEYIARRYQEARAEVPVLEGEDAFHAKIREIFYLTQTRYMPVLLDRKDRMSMAVAFEVRVPFCDHHLVEYVWNIPWEMKAVGRVEKGLLRHVFADILPHEMRSRRKSPFPTSLHPQYRRSISEWYLQIVNDANAPLRPFLNVPAARKLATGNLYNLPLAMRLAAMEQAIQMNTWLKEYRVRIC